MSSLAIIEEVKAFELSLEQRYGIYVKLSVEINGLANLVDVVNEVYKAMYLDKYMDGGIRNKRRGWVIVMFRDIYYYIGSELGYSLVDIGSEIGRGHCNVHYGRKSIIKALKKKGSVEEELINKIKSEFKQFKNKNIWNETNYTKR